jgi:hypothetical protein
MVADIKHLLNNAGPAYLDPPYRAPVFNHAFAYWNRSFGVDLTILSNCKIVVFGIPKSGNTWLVSLISDALAIPVIDPVNDSDAFGVGMTHIPFSPIVSDRSDFLHGACLIRDLRDVLCSFFAYSQTAAFRSARREFHFDNWDDFYFDWFLSRGVAAFNPNQFCHDYAIKGVPVVRYEKLLHDPYHEMTRLLNTWGLAYDVEKLEAAIESNGFKKLASGGKNINVAVPPSHFRRGSAGSFRDEMPPNIRADVEKRFSWYFQRWGYDL